MKTSSFTHLVSTSLLSISFIVMLASCGKKESIEPTYTREQMDNSGRKAIQQNTLAAEPTHPVDPTDPSIRQIKNTILTDVATTEKVKDDRTTYQSEQNHTNGVSLNEGISANKGDSKEKNDFQIKNPEIRRVMPIDKSDDPSEEVIRRKIARKNLYKSPK